MAQTTPTGEQIDEQLNEALEAIQHGSQYPGLSYEEGVEATIRWMIGEASDAPMEP